MPSVSIDFGAKRTKLAIYDRRTKSSVVASSIPTLFHVARSGAISVGQDAEQSIKSDPAGAIDDLKSRIGHGNYLRNRHSCSPSELLRHLLVRLHTTAVERRCAVDGRVSCSILIPLTFDILKIERFRDTALAAGFESVEMISEPVAVMRFFENVDGPIVTDDVVVCDLGGTAKATVMRRRDAVWRPALELCPPENYPRGENGPSQIFLDALLRLQSTLAENKIRNAPLLIVGGDSRSPELVARMKQEGWTGSIALHNDSEFAAALGAIVVPMDADLLICPECDAFPVSPKAIICGNCGLPVRLMSQPLPTSDSNGNREVRTCPECTTINSLETKVCKLCGFPLH
ncbi:MAG: zinc ribbon domain-containing protein [Pirellulales bacterium]